MQTIREDRSVGVFGAGLLAGIACYGYFIFFFLVPALGLHAWLASRPIGRKTVACWWGAGFLLGVSPYPIGFLMIWHAAGSLAAAVGTVQETVKRIDPDLSRLDVVGRVEFFATYARATLEGVGPKLVMLQENIEVLPTLRLALMASLAVALAATILFPRFRPPGFAVLSGLVLGLLGLALAFGNRLWLHHFGILLPIAYLGLASIIEGGLRCCKHRMEGACAAVALAAVALLAGLNVADAKRVFAKLEETGGVGFASDAINRFAFDAAGSPQPTFYFFPDWGVSMGFVMLTEGRVPHKDDVDLQLAHTKLCEGRDVVIVVLADKEPERLAKWQDTLQWGEPALSTYLQRNGEKLLVVARWPADRRPVAACEG